jgi:hypothetical protein
MTELIETQITYYQYTLLDEDEEYRLKTVCEKWSVDIRSYQDYEYYAVYWQPEGWLLAQLSMPEITTILKRINQIGRPKPQILASLETDQYQLDIIQSPSLWTVMYNNNVINIRRCYYAAEGTFLKYQKSTYTTRPVAENLAKKLNQQFNSTLFQVKEILSQHN